MALELYSYFHGRLHIHICETTLFGANWDHLNSTAKQDYLLQRVSHKSYHSLSWNSNQ